MPMWATRIDEKEFYEELRAKEEAILRRALDLTEGCDPSFNLHPTIDLIRKAREMGYDVVKR